MYVLDANTLIQAKKVKIPTVCQALDVPCVRTFAMLRELSARFVLQK